VPLFSFWGWFYEMKKFLQTHPQITKAIWFFSLYLHNIFEPWTGSSSGALYNWTVNNIKTQFLRNPSAKFYPWIKAKVSFISCWQYLSDLGITIFDLKELIRHKKSFFGSY
jgi:hypothetical protein